MDAKAVPPSSTCAPLRNAQAGRLRPMLNSESATTVLPKTKTALVVDDVPSVRCYHNHILTRAGFTCRTAPNGREALSLLQEQRVDLVMLDLVMPEMTGEEFLRHLHENSAWANIAVLIISSESLGTRIRRDSTPTSGPVGFVRKPLMPAAILAEVKHLLG